MLKAFPEFFVVVDAAGTGLEDLASKGSSITGSLSTLSSPQASNTVRSFVRGAGSVTSITPPTKFWDSGYELVPFSLAAAVSPGGFTGKISIMSHDTAGFWDGLFFDDDKLVFSLEYNDGPVQVSYPLPDITSSMNVVATYTVHKASVFVDGTQVGEIDIPEDKLMSGFKAPVDNKLYTGQTSGTTVPLSAGYLAGFRRALSGSEVNDINLSSIGSAARVIGPYFPETSMHFAENIDRINIDIDYTSGVESNVNVANGSIYPLIDSETQTSLSGNWMYVIPLSSISQTVYGVQVWWESDGNIPIESSLDSGVTWSPMVNGRIISGSFPMSVADSVVLIRASFAGGILNDTSRVYNIRASVLLSNSITDIGSQWPMVITSGVAPADRYTVPLQGRANAGIELYAGTASIDADTVRAVAFLSKTNTSANQTLIQIGSSSIGVSSGKLVFSGATSVNINGINTATNISNISPGQWNHIVAVLSADYTGTISFPAGLKNVSDVYLFRAPLTTGQMRAMYDMTYGYPVASFSEQSAIDVEESSTPPAVYGYLWDTLNIESR